MIARAQPIRLNVGIAVLVALMMRNEVMELTAKECNRIRQWFNAVEDAAPEYLVQADRDLMQKIATACTDKWQKKPQQSLG
jgi:hypothetical protein